MTIGSSIESVLVPLDLGAGSDHVLHHARLVADRFEARLTLYHAVGVPDHQFAHWAFAHEHEVWIEAERQAKDALERRAREIGEGVVAIVERATSVHQAIVDVARRTSPDLVVMATHGREGIAHLLLGSVTEKIVQRIRRPVLCVRDAEHEDAFPYRRILVTTDFSLASRLVFPLAAQLARKLGAEVLTVHVARGETLASLSGIPEPGPIVVPSEASLWKFLCGDFEGLKVRAQVHTGTIWERIVHAARVEKADLIVMSTRGHDSLADRILGSNTERVLRHAPCPVLVA